MPHPRRTYQEACPRPWPRRETLGGGRGRGARRGCLQTGGLVPLSCSLPIRWLWEAVPRHGMGLLDRERSPDQARGCHSTVLESCRWVGAACHRGSAQHPADDLACVLRGPAVLVPTSHSPAAHHHPRANFLGDPRTGEEGVSPRLGVPRASLSDSHRLAWSTRAPGLYARSIAPSDPTLPSGRGAGRPLETIPSRGGVPDGSLSSLPSCRCFSARAFRK